MKIAIFGTTLYAAVTAALMAECGHYVYICSEDLSESLDCFDIKEQDVVQALDKQLKGPFLQYCNFASLPLDVDAYFFSYSPLDISKAFAMAEKLKLKTIIHPKLMVNASTFGLKGTQKLKAILSEDDWVYLPDTVQEGQAIFSVSSASKVIIGCDDIKLESKLKEMLRPLFPREQQYLFMPIVDAEFTKLSISGMLATRISYMNDLAVVAEKLGIDISNVRDGMASDSRIGAAYLYAGAGFGGENFSHDILTLSNTIAGTGIKSRLLDQVWEINEQQKEFLFRKLWNYFHGDLAGKTVAIWGASFKVNTSSTHFSPIHIMLEALWAQGVKVRLHDPQALDEILEYYGDREDLTLCADQYQAADGAHALCILTAWKQYWSLDYQQLKTAMRHPLILDGRNIYQPDYVKGQGFAYMGVGR